MEKLAAQEQKHFPFEILVAATNNFHPSLKLGEGGFGPVYKVGIELIETELNGIEFVVLKLAGEAG